MTISDRDPWQVVGDALYPITVAAAWLAAPFRKAKPVNHDRHYDPPEPIVDREEIRWCSECDADTWMNVIRWHDGPASAECQECDAFEELDE